MKKGYIPNQHGAWAMLVIPFLFGMFAAGPVLLHLLLFAVWLLAFLFSNAFLQWVRTRKLQIYGGPMAVYGSLLAAAGVLTLILRPELVRFLPAFVPLFLVNLYYAKINKERAFVNDLAAVVQFSLIVFVAYFAGGGTDWLLAAELFGLGILYFTGTVFYVKTIIRERHNVRYYRMSVGYHLLLFAAGLLLFPAGIAVPLAILLIRAIVAPRTRITVKRSGMLEFAYSALLLCAVPVFYHFL